ncbi:lantibiotic dehydratase [Actinophytocola xanthii]|uniref:Lantibiotic dehydratase N-terminal domain-containing protein n=1 Tax=Actinophytocola xanthii TaxID=1912961 RepID=A0A1Q8CK36_9PSEU|nr:lantibiotic dehydratase [Actinophytocola xanthii]OLF14693.1 hypothetical protein BU204_25725 [Actinophytocola xanthii]
MPVAPDERHATGGQGWQVFRTGFLRSAGLPFDWLEALAEPALDDLTDRALEARGRLYETRWEVVRGLRALAAHSDDERLRWAVNRVSRYHDVPDEQFDDDARPLLASWREAFGAISAATDSLAVALYESSAREVRLLVEHVGEDYFTEAVLLSSPNAYPEMCWSAEHKRFRRGRELLAYRYLQRFCGKNETGGYTGPLNLFTFDGDQVTEGSIHRDAVLGPVSYTAAGDGRAARRRTFMAYWAASAVGNALLEDLPAGAAHRTPRRVIAAPPAAVAGLSELDARVLARLDTAADRASLAAALGLPRDVVEASLARLTALGLVLDDWYIPDFTVDAGSALADLVRRLDTPRAALATELLRRIAAYPETDQAGRPALVGDIASRFTELTNHAPWRRGGVLMGDRAVFYDDAQDNVLGAAATRAGAERLGERLSTVMDFLASVAIEERLAGQEVLTRALRDRGVDTLPATEVRGMPRDGAGTVERSMRRFADLVDPAQPVVELTRSDLVAAGLIRDDLHAWPLFGAADLMLAGGAPDDPAQVILSELHHIWPTTACQIRALYDDGQLGVEELWDVVARELAPAVPTLQQIRRDQKGTDSSPCGHRVLCLDTTIPVPGTRTVAVDRLEVRRWPNGFVGLHDPGDDRDLWLLPEYEDTYVAVGGLMNCALPALELPRLATGTHTPRIVLDGVVVQRRRWVLTRSDVPAPRGNQPTAKEWLAITRWRHRLGLPRRLYFTVDTEEKPMYLDLASVTSVRNFSRCLAAAQGVVLTEALPTPDQLWLTTPTGRLTAEIRVQLWRDRGRARPAGGEGTDG